MLIRSEKNIFGLDLGDQALRLVQLKKQGKNTILKSYNEVKVPDDVIVDGVIKKEDQLVSLINQLIATVQGEKIKTRNIIACLPETKTFIKVTDIVSGDAEQLPELIKEEVKNHMPLDPEEIYFDWQIIGSTPKTTKLLIGAAPKEIVDSYFATLEKSGLTPLALEVEAASITRSLLKENDQSAKIIIDFGAVRTGLIVYDQGTIQFTVSLPISGNKITQTIAKTLNLDLTKAEKAKVVCGLDPEKCEGALLKILLSAIEELIGQIKSTAMFYKTNFAGSNAITEIVLCGGGANFAGIDRVLSEKLGLPVKISNPLNNIKTTNKIAIPKEKILSYTTAIGLALRAFEK
ncbi:MAG: hypothetical protein A2744_02085 [Candidatus Buchananbacteria bacterium RIFCSPHIGHO2_01_FULL_44_11]|uniref:SHS2 domain-containing protein n=1 Tax=Candidatus Buchananbacteria bacterium RIFCSPHIGHO2_01_FULL_44_11 TaxID=1797535 RepID=A0A1G1XZU0_9BACT|nr:MAG: hypothetical protein A2744_02085 [Candidatus Buchananbacteria bacterium RIFCSPHIGHO2_01_FULL_44_11]